MESAVEIAKLCGSWGEHFSDSAEHEHINYAHRFLALLGWDDPSPSETGTRDSPTAPLCFFLRGDSESTVAAYFTQPGSLDSPTSLGERGLDFCETTRRLVDQAHESNICYAFITDLYRFYLYDAITDEFILGCDTPEGPSRDLLEVLTRTSVERGALEEVRRDPRSTSARRLREWRQHWTEIIHTQTAADEEAASLIMDRLLILRYLFDHDTLKGPGRPFRDRYAELVSVASSPNPEGCGRALTTLFHDLWFDWKAELFRPTPNIDEAMESDAVAAPMLKEFALMSRAKFSVATILESFNYGDAAEKARVRLVPENDSEREGYLAKQTLETVDDARITVDLMDEGYRAVCYWFDKLVGVYSRLGVAFDATRSRDASVASDAMDLFTWSEMDADRPGALKDHFQHAIEQGLVVLYATPRQHRIARLLLYLHTISRYSQDRQRFAQFPRIETALDKRPALTEAEKRWNRRRQTEEVA